MSKKHNTLPPPTESIMDLKQLRYFTHVAELGSYTRAAELIDVAQPVLSRQIRKLETDLHQNLLIRHGRGVVLTDAGKTLLKHSRLILQQLEQAQEDLCLADGKLSGHMCLGLPPTFGRTISLDVVKRFKSDFPDAQLTLVEALTVNLAEAIHLGRINIGVLYNPSSSQHLDTELLAEENLYLITSQDSPYSKGRDHITLKELAEVPLVMPSVSNSFRLLLEREMLKINLKPHVELEINSVGVITQILAEGMGAAILSKSVLDFIPQRRLLKAIPIVEPTLINRIYLAYSSKRLPSKLQKKMVTTIKEIAAKHYPPAS